MQDVFGKRVYCSRVSIAPHEPHTGDSVFRLTDERGKYLRSKVAALVTPQESAVAARAVASGNSWKTIPVLI